MLHPEWRNEEDRKEAHLMEIEHMNWGGRQKNLIISRVSKGMGNGNSQTLSKL